MHVLANTRSMKMSLIIFYVTGIIKYQCSYEEYNRRFWLTLSTKFIETLLWLIIVMSKVLLSYFYQTYMNHSEVSQKKVVKVKIRSNIIQWFKNRLINYSTGEISHCKFKRFSKALTLRSVIRTLPLLKTLVAKAQPFTVASQVTRVEKICLR